MKKFALKLFDSYRSASRPKKITIRILTGLFALLLFVTISAEFTSRPSFCGTCHYMEPFVQSWKTSTHGEVTCTQCHFPPGLAGTVRGKLEGLMQVVNYLGGSYLRRRPWAEITDASCLTSGCHETRLLTGRVEFKGVAFDHEAHLGEIRRGKSLRCTSCHSQIVQGDHMVVTETSCFLCHFKQGGSVEPDEFETLSDCQTCHHWDLVPPEKMAEYRFDHTEVTKRNIDCLRCHNQTIVGDGFVPRENCYSCHFDKERLDQFDNSDLLHRVHISEHKIECIQCHLRIQHKVQQLSVDAEVDCATCHTGTHREQLMLFTGQEFNGVHGEANPMFESGLNCASCHLFHEHLIGEAEVKVARSESCETCHGRGYGRLLNLWEESADKKLAALRTALTGAEASLAGKLTGAVKTNLDKARNGMAIVEAGKAIHNIKYSDRIIAKSYEYLQQAVRLGQSDFKVPEFASSPVVPSECANCHTGVESITSTFGDLDFSHEKHLVAQGLKCNTCHSNTRRHGELILNLESCNACHHAPARQNDCATCHESAADIYAGTLTEGMAPDIMAEAEIECSECHVRDDLVVRPDASVCLDCHEEGYDETAKEWKEAIVQQLADVYALIDTVRTTPEAGGAEFRQLQQLVRALQSESAFGIHNYEATSELLDNAQSSLEEMAKKPNQ